MTKNFVLLMATAVLAIFLAAGCGQKKEAPKVSQEIQAQVVPGELPELEQNKIDQTDRIENGQAPDYSFHPVPDEQEPRSPEAAAKQSPPTD